MQFVAWIMIAAASQHADASFGNLEPLLLQSSLGAKSTSDSPMMVSLLAISMMTYKRTCLDAAPRPCHNTYISNSSDFHLPNCDVTAA